MIYTKNDLLEELELMWNNDDDITYNDYESIKMFIERLED